MEILVQHRTSAISTFRYHCQHMSIYSIGMSVAYEKVIGDHAHIKISESEVQRMIQIKNGNIGPA